jgi:hypothetical protein
MDVLRTIDRFLGMEVSGSHTAASGPRTERVTMDTAYRSDGSILSYYPYDVHYSQGRDVSVDGNNVSVVIDGKTFSGTMNNTEHIPAYWRLKSVVIEPRLSTTRESLINPGIEYIGLTYNLDEMGTTKIHLSWTKAPRRSETLRGSGQYSGKDHTRQDNERGSDSDDDKLTRHKRAMAPPNPYGVTDAGRMVVNQVYNPRDPTTNHPYPY